MPQEFHVIRCYSCETFQVHIVKKSNKWDCKMCGEKQSIKKVYFQGSGKDCRLNVQKLNEKRILNELNTKTPENSEINEFENQTQKVIFSEQVNLNSKWEEFLPTKQESSDSQDEVEKSMYCFNRPNKRKSFTKRTTENKKIKSEELNTQDQNFQNENVGTSKWKSFISNMKSNSQNALKEASNKPNLLSVDDEMKKSKWDCFVDNDDDEIPDQDEINVSLDRDTKSTNIFSSDNTNLDDILTL